MPILGPITSPPKIRNFGVIDLEWVPARRMPLPENVEVVFEGMRQTCRIPMPVDQRVSDPLKVRMASFYDQPSAGDGDQGDEPVREERFLCFDTVRELNEFVLSSENRGRWIYAHAGGLADMEFVLDDLFAELKANLDARTNLARVYISEELKAKGIDKIEDYVKGSWKIRASFSGSSAIIINVSRGKNAWHLLDSYWLFRDSLASIGKAIGIKKGDSPLAVEFLKKRFGKGAFDELDDRELEAFYADAPLDVLKSYNRTDCEILWKAIAQFEQEILELGGQLQQTIASTGMNLIRRAYLKESIYTSDRVNQIAEMAYSSSRVEVVSRYIEDGDGFDINSSFPYSMTFPQPSNLRQVRTTLPEDDSDSCIYLADVTIEVPDMPFPPLPFRQGGRVFFPVGRWRAWFDSTDIRLALREGCILHKVHEVYVFEPFLDIANFVRDVYGKRAATKDPFKKILYKYLLNCPYGKFAEGVWKQEMLINPDKIERDKLQLLQPGIWLAEKKATVAHRHVPISCHITALSRRLLYDYVKECYAQGHPPAYMDSITGDRTVVLRSPDGRVHVDPIEEVWERDSESRKSRGSKEVGQLAGWQALARTADGTSGWFDVKKIIRHKTIKPTFLLSSKSGQTRVTEDHSLVVGGEEIKPEELIRRGIDFETVPAQPFVVRDEIDLFEEVKHFQRERPRVVNSLGADERGIYYVGYREPKTRFKSVYRRGTKEFHSFLRVLAAYLAEGSSSLIQVTTDTRDMFSLCQQDREWLEALKVDLESITSGVSFTGPKWSEGSRVHYLRSGASLLPAIFGTLGGFGSKSKKLPSFIYELDDVDFQVFWLKLLEGDGTKDLADRDMYNTSSQRLAAGLSYVLSQHGIEHSIHYRKEKGAYQIRCRPTGSIRERFTMQSERGVADGYVYDLEVDGAHTFVDGLGRVLLHNTDSLFTKAKLPVDETKLGALKHEKKIAWAEFFVPKIYRGEGFELGKDGQWKSIQITKAKGFSLGRKSKGEAWDRFNRIASGDRIGIQRQVRMRELYRTGETAPVDVLVIKALMFDALTKRFHYPDGDTRPWSVEELRSGDFYPAGFDFEDDLQPFIDTTTRAMMEAVV